MPDLPTVEQADAAVTRFERFVSRQLTRTHWSGDAALCAGRDFIQRAWWINARRNYLNDVLTAAACRRTTKEVKHG